MKLTAAQRTELERLVTLKLPPSWTKLGFPGHPERCCDMRVIPTLKKRGLVESQIYEYFTDIHNAPISHSERRVVVVYRATDAGRASLKTAKSTS